MSQSFTPKQFTELARATSRSLQALGVAVHKGHYCHILEATARGLGFTSKSALDDVFHQNPSAPLPAQLDEPAARVWLLRTGMVGPIPDRFLTTPFQTLFPSLSVSTKEPIMSPPNPMPNAPATPANSNIVSQYAARVWSTADTLRGVGAKASEWPGHMMPFFALMLLESRALRARNQAIETFGGQFDPNDPQDVYDLKVAYVSAADTSSQTYHDDLVLHGQGLAHVVSGGPSGFSQRLRSYLNGYDESTRRLLGVNPGASSKVYLNIEGTVRFLESKGGEHLWHYCNAWSQVNLVGYDSSAVTTLEEHIKRKWADISADTAGEHYTPADLIDLVSSIALDHFNRHPLSGNFLRIYDPTCGGGNMLFGVEDGLRAADEKGLLKNAKGESYSIQSFGQELNDTLFSLAAIESRFRPSSTIKEGNTLSDDQFAHEKFHLIVANPPYGTDWKQIQSDINNDQTGRFPATCRPPVSDGQHLFLQHIQHHLTDDGLALVFCSGSTLFSGDAGGGESNARSKYILTDDGVWGIIQLPKNEFFNTGINTYIWVFKKCKPQSMSQRMFLLNAETLFSKLRKSLGNKNSEITEHHRAKIVRLLAAIEEPSLAQQLVEDGMALTADITNRMQPAVVSGWVNEDGVFEANEGALSKFQADLARMKEVNLKVISLKEATPEEPALLRLLRTEDVHYSKVSLDVVRSNEYGAFKGHLTLDPMLLRFGESMLWTTWSLPVMSDFLTKKTSEEVLSDAKSIERALKGLIKNGEKIWVMEQEGQPTYEWSSEDRTLFKDGVPQGRANFDLKIKALKKNGGRDVKFQITFEPDLEKDTETTPFKIDDVARNQAIDAFLARWVKDGYTKTDVTVGCEINFNRMFPKTADQKTLTQVNEELAEIDALIAQLHQGGV